MVVSAKNLVVGITGILILVWQMAVNGTLTQAVSAVGVQNLAV